MRIWLDPDKLAVRGMAVNDVIAALREQNAAVALGQMGLVTIRQPGISFSPTATASTPI